MAPSNELQHMRLAIREARRSRTDERRTDPYVGAVVVRDEELLASACRGDLANGDHAEFTALEGKLPKETLAGCTVYTTLEPCTTRGHPTKKGRQKVPCADRLIQRRVSRVVIGMLDPDQRITGQGVLRLRRAGIAVDLFPPDLMAELEELNREFIRDREARPRGAPGVTEAGIAAFYPSRAYYSRFRGAAPTIDRYLATAQRTATLVSINLATGLPFDDLCLCIAAKLAIVEPRFRLAISLLDPSSPELMAVMAPILNLEPSELATSIRRSARQLLDLRTALPPEAALRFAIRYHRALPFGSAILLDCELPDGRIQIETKPYKAGLGKSFSFEVRRGGEAGFYEVLMASYAMLIEEGRAVDVPDVLG